MINIYFIVIHVSDEGVVVGFIADITISIVSLIRLTQFPRFPVMLGVVKGPAFDILESATTHSYAVVN